MNILLVSRHTRLEEQTGRSELLRADAVGRHAPLTAALLLALSANLVLALAIAGSLAAKKYTPETAGSFPTTGALWTGLLVGIVLIVGGLTFLPSLALGPIADHLAMIRGQLF